MATNSELKPGCIFIDVDRGPEGCCLCISDGETGHRIAGPKPWGGSENLHSFQVKTEELIRIANAYAHAQRHSEAHHEE